MKNIKNQLYFELLETTIYQWFGRTVRIHNSTTTARRVIIIKDKFHRSQRTSRRFCAKVISEQFIILGSLISTLQSLLGLCLSLGLQATAPLLRFPNVWFEYIPPKFVNLKLGLSNTSLVSAPFLPPILEFAVYYNMTNGFFSKSTELQWIPNSPLHVFNPQENTAEKIWIWIPTTYPNDLWGKTSRA